MKTPATKPYRVLIADDHTVARLGIRMLVQKQPGLEVCSEASTGMEAVECTKKEKPDLVILDLTMPEMNGLEATRVIREEVPETQVLILSMHFSEELAREAFRAGALGYMLKSDAESELLSAIDHVRHNEPFFTSQLAASMMETFVDRDRPDAHCDLNDPCLRLTSREVEVVRALAEGNSNKQVAAALGVSVRTIESHRNHIMHKMNFASFSDLVRFAIRTNLVEA
ncbi:MAG TPA: response regulator transcription factor [Candidatus Limnocylindrales bacterium]|nr:response regulator transcription factor [Candidatus Limnocylindrales bacterium]